MCVRREARGRASGGGSGRVVAVVAVVAVVREIAVWVRWCEKCGSVALALAMHGYVWHGLSQQPRTLSSVTWPRSMAMVSLSSVSSSVRVPICVCAEALKAACDVVNSFTCAWGRGGGGQ